MRMTTGGRRHFLSTAVQDDQCLLNVRFVLLALGWETDPIARWFLIKAAGMLRINAAVPLLLQICEEPDVELEHTSLHAICAWTLGRIGELATEAVMRLLVSSSLETRRCAADALGEIGSRSAVPALISALKEDERPVQLWAGLSLAKIGAHCEPHLQRVVEESEGATRLIALDALDKIARQRFS